MDGGAVGHDEAVRPDGEEARADRWSRGEAAPRDARRNDSGAQDQRVPLNAAAAQRGGAHAASAALEGEGQ